MKQIHSMFQFSSSHLSPNHCLLLPMIAMLIVYSCSKGGNMTPNSPNSDTETLSHNGETREYILYVPDVYDGNSEVPLMLNFHGFGMTASQQLSFADMRSLADANNFILVYPQGTLLDGSPHWNSGLESNDNKSDADDFGFVEALIDNISSNYSIDEKRVYACGYSNGAFFSYSLACYHSDKIAAIGSVSGTMMEETLNNCTPSHPLAMINLHGTSDGTVSYEGGTGLISIDAVLAYWAGFNNTTSTPDITSIDDNGTTIEHHVYAEGDNNVSVEHYKIVGGKHVWFDINYEGASTSQLIWEFVSRYDIDGLR